MSPKSIKKWPANFLVTKKSAKSGGTLQAWTSFAQANYEKAERTHVPRLPCQIALALWEVGHIAPCPGKPLDLQSIVTGWRQPCLTHVHYRVFPVRCFSTIFSLAKSPHTPTSWWYGIGFSLYFILRNLPRSSEELKNWMIRLYQVWAGTFVLLF